jgi:type I restriction enzyme R subunit
VSEDTESEDTGSEDTESEDTGSVGRYGVGRKIRGRIFTFASEEREEIKKMAKQLLARLKDLLVLGWRLKIGARAQVRLAIEDTLDDGLPRAYSKELYQTKCTAVFACVRELPGRGEECVHTSGG